VTDYQSARARLDKASFIECRSDASAIHSFLTSSATPRRRDLLCLRSEERKSGSTTPRADSSRPRGGKGPRARTSLRRPRYVYLDSNGKREREREREANAGRSAFYEGETRKKASRSDNGPIPPPPPRLTTTTTLFAENTENRESTSLLPSPSSDIGPSLFRSRHISRFPGIPRDLWSPYTL